eukprot:TRINITY_DN1867_c0_g1_i1.p1 TRINITY_DN1867_c0_g1~~TRINITY_DN1867_c0_g1_i1.p1  ORF type:complete len:103 (-),score=26.57 TRINITY_DN1867_c0_g1_i1:84-392(-)
MSIYIRAKRTNQTIFLYAEPSDTIATIKKKISSITKSPVDTIRLLSHPDHVVLEDDKTLGDKGIENEGIVYWVLKKSGTDSYEEVSIQKVETAKQEEKSADS